MEITLIKLIMEWVWTSGIITEGFQLINLINKSLIKKVYKELSKIPPEESMAGTEDNKSGYNTIHYYF